MQDSDWEEVEADDGEADKNLMHAAGVTSFGQPTHEHLEAIAKVFNKVFFFYHIFNGNSKNLAVDIVLSTGV